MFAAARNSYNDENMPASHNDDDHDDDDNDDDGDDDDGNRDDDEDNNDDDGDDNDGDDDDDDGASLLWAGCLLSCQTGRNCEAICLF